MTTFPPGPVRVPRQAPARRARARPSSPRLAVELAVAADLHGPVPLTGQITQQLREALADGPWPPGSGCRPPERWPPPWA